MAMQAMNQLHAVANVVIAHQPVVAEMPQGGMRRDANISLPREAIKSWKALRLVAKVSMRQYNRLWYAWENAAMK